jgi:hypothetical protein
MSEQKRHMIIVIALVLFLAVLTTGCPGRTVASTATTNVTTASSMASATTSTASPTSTSPTPTNTTAQATSATTTRAPSSTTSLSPTRKPAIYFYPQMALQVHVTLRYDGRLTCTYPSYPEDGWRVTAYPDGRLFSQADGREYSYLYWEGLTETKYDFRRGFVVAGQDTAAFLQEKLAFMGLTPREYNEFIVFWLPQMQDNSYNLITFQGKAYTDQAILSIEPKPDSVLRVFMAYKPLQESLEIEEQELSRFERTGFTVVEWGGTCIE